MKQSNVLSLFFAGVLFLYWISTSQATPTLLTWSAFTNASDLSGLTGNLENGDPANIFGGVGSGLAWAGGNSFVMSPDRGPNAVAWNSNLDNTTSYISRLQNVTMELNQSSPGVFNLTPILTGTTLLYSTDPLTYGATSTVVGGNYYFNGRSDNFGTGNSLNTNNARSDPEGVRVSPDGRYVYVSDEYGPYVYQFDRETGVRTKAFVLPDNLGVTNLSSQGAVEIANNVSGRVANKGMEGLAISPDGSTLFGFMQGPLLQDTNGGGYYNRIVKINVATGETHEYAYDNRVGGTNNSSELLAINDHEFLVLERDNTGLGSGTSAAVKNLIKIDLTGATDVTALSGSASLAPYAVSGTVFLNIVTALNNAGISSSNIPSKLEGIAWGQDVMINGTNTHTLYMANDNDFVTNTSGPSKVFVFGVTDADLGGSSLTNQSISLQLGGDLYVGSNSTVAPVSYTSGTNFYNNIYVGYGATASNNQLLVANVGTLLTNSGEFYVGYSGSGNSLTVSNGGKVLVSGISNNWLSIGENDGANSNTVTVTGSNSQLNVAGWLEVGWGSNTGNQMLISDGGLVSDSNGYIGYTNGSSSNSVAVSTSGTWSNSSSFYVGYSGSSNNLVISGAGTVTDLAGTIGYHGDGNGATVTGSNSLWSNASSLTVGNCGNAALLTISNGGGVISSSGLISAISGWSNCSVTVTGGGSYWSNSGNLTIGSQANGLNAPSSGNSLTISSGGEVSDSNAVIANATSFFNNTVTVTGFNSLWSNSGSIDLGVLGSQNSLVISNGGSVLAAGIIETNGTTDGPLSVATTIGDSNTSTNNSVLITGSGSSMTNAGRLRIGYYGSGNSLTVTNGGQLIGTRNANITLGYDIGSLNNQLQIGGSNTFSSNNGGIFVGYGGSGNSISLSGGATMISGSTNPSYYGSNINYNDSYVGFYAASSNNSINLSGRNTAWMNTGSLNIGYDGSGNTMVVSNGASLIMIQAIGTNAWISLGENSNSFGNSLTVATNSIASAQYVDVGWSGGSNVMTVKDGGIVTDTYGVIGHDSNSYGNSVLVTGSNSHWDSATSLIVGSYGNSNSLVISNGGKVSDFQAGLGVDATMAPTSSSGNGVLITGSNSIWTNADIFVIGCGTVTLADGGILAAAQIQIGQYGTLNIGRLGTNDSAGSVAGELVFTEPNDQNSGINFNQTNSLIMTNGISGPGWVCQLGTGTTTLSASNSYSHYTAVDAGELHISPTGSLNGGGTTTIATGGTLRNEGYISGQTVINGILCGNNGSFQNLKLEPGASSSWHISSFTGTAGVSWDLLSTTNLDLSDLSLTNPFTINVIGSSGEGDGSLSYVFSYINVTGVLSAFNSADFFINTTNFTMSPNLAGGSWNVTSTLFDGVTTLSVTYAVPEPSSYVLFLFGVIGVGMICRNRKV
jgi:T5SS/PEP-CTERM-associated repeat protein